MTTRDALRQLASQLPAETPVPVPAGMLLELLDGPNDDALGGDLTAAAVAKWFGRAPSTIRGWCEDRLLEGAYRLNGREWRIPPAALDGFIAKQQRTHHGTLKTPPPVRSARSGGKGKRPMSSWRKEGAA